MTAESVQAPASAPQAARDGARSLPGALPNLIVIGAQKCGTSGLHYYLSLHPEVSMSRPKELNFFIAERNWGRGIEWYGAHFDARANVRGESSPNYTAYPQHESVPERMHATVPEARLVYLVRDPLERIAAHWVHNYAKRRERGDLRTTLLHPQTSYVARSRYHLQLEQFLRFYDRDRVLVIEQGELRFQREETLRRVFEFIQVDPDFTHPRFREERHQTSRKMRSSRLALRLEQASRSRGGRRLPAAVWLGIDALLPLRRRIPRPDVRGALGPEVVAELREDAERLCELVGRRYENWSIWR